VDSHSHAIKVDYGHGLLLVAIDHGLLLARDGDDPIKIGAEKDQLEALLRAEIPKRKVRFIAEESNIGKATIASVLASASNP